MKTSKHWAPHEDALVRRIVAERRAAGVSSAEWAEELAAQLSGRTASACQQRASALGLTRKRHVAATLPTPQLDDTRLAALEARVVALESTVSALSNALLTTWASLGDALEHCR